jgi:hypothetical protein
MGYAAFSRRAKRTYQCVEASVETHITSAGVAQLVEQRIRNAKVGCSIHLTGTIKVAVSRDLSCCTQDDNSSPCTRSVACRV